MAEYKIVEVLDGKSLDRFVKFPDELYRGCPQYVPALHSDQKKSLTKSASLSYCSRKMWLAMDGGKIVGRICAMINPRYNELYDKKRVRFGWFDCINDIEVASLLIGTAEAWAREQGMTEIHGPLYYNTFGKQGMLVEGFENIPPFNCLYNYPYYVDLVTKLGFEKECDWVQYKVKDGGDFPEKASRVAEIVKQRYNLHFGSLNALKHDKEQVRKFFHAYNDSFSTSVYNYIPLTEEEIEEEAASMIPYVNDKISCILMDEHDELVAFGISFPTISPALQKAKGKLFPFGWIHLLKAMNNFETIDLMVNGAVSEWQNKGVSAVYYKAMKEKSSAVGNLWGITNPQIESNSAVNIWKDYETEPFMRRRCFIKQIK